MATFKSHIASDTVEGKYSGRKLVYLESDDDKAIFQRWFFDEGEFIEFISSSENGSGGCTKVIGFVDKDRGMGIPSFGIIDRDALMREQLWEAFWEKDDDVYRVAYPFGAYVRPLCRWEIENYLLDPNVIYALLLDYGKYSPDGIDRELLAANLLRQCKALVPVMVANICLHMAGRPALPQGFCSDEKTPEAIKTKCLNYLEKQGVDCRKFEVFKNRILSFLDGDDTSTQYWQLSRIIDGKRLILRFNLAFGLKEDHRYNLAKMIREQHRVPSEIKDLIIEIKAAA